MHGRIIFTDNGHYRAERELFPSLNMPGATSLTVSGRGNESFLGFGVAITQSSCYELSLMSPEERGALLRQLYSKDGLGLSVGRLCIGACDYSPEIYSYDDVEDDTSLKHFSVERDERYVIPMIKEILAVAPELYLYASPWSPPYWMKTGGSMCGGYMRDKYVECYVEYIVKYIKAYAERGINIRAITPQNEPNTQQSGRMPACAWHPETAARLVKLLRRRLDEEGLEVGIWLHDHNFADTPYVIWSLKNCRGLARACDGVAFHYYEGSVEQTAALSESFPSLGLHFTEGGPRLNESYGVDWCKWGLMIVRALKVGYRSFTGWNLMLDELGGPNVGPFMGICGGLITRDSRTGELSYSGQYKAFSHFAPYLTEQSRVLPLESEETRGEQLSAPLPHLKKIEGVLIDTPDKNKVAVLINPNECAMQTQIRINGNLWYVELQANSITSVEL